MSVAARPRAATATSALSFHRRFAGTAGEPPNALGARELGGADASLPLLWPAGPVADVWCGEAPVQVPVQVQQRGAVRFATDGHWLHGCVELAEGGFEKGREGGLQHAARQAYAELFGVLAGSACPHLLRLWNYLPDINRDDGRGERYRQFNAGRQQAFIDAQRSAFDGSPAACALGATHGPLRVYFLAGCHAPLAIENPRQVSAYRYPTHYGPRSPTFSRAAVADAGAGVQALFISGTASIVGHASVHVGDVRRQTQETLANVEVLRLAAARCADAPFDAQRLVYTVYLRDPADLAAVRDEFERHVGPSSVAATGALYVRADVCRADLLVEIEAHGFAPRNGAASAADAPRATA